MPLKKPLLPATYFPRESENRMAHVGDLPLARERFLKHRPNNLHFLLRHRYEWMNEFVQDKEVVLELGAGCGFSKQYIHNPRLRLTDVVAQPWIDEVVDAMSLPYPAQSVDAIVCNHMIHHLAEPKKFLLEALKVLKPGGVVVISEVNTSWLMCFILRLMRHEGWSYEVDIFGPAEKMRDPSNPWTANCATAELLFSDESRFERELAGFKIKKNTLSECFILLISGGVIAKTKTLQLPFWALHIVSWIDRICTRWLPGFFAMERQVVLQKT